MTPSTRPSLCNNLKLAIDPRCRSLQSPFTLKFANSAGFDILETTMVNIQDMPLEAVLDDEGRKSLFTELPKIMQQVLLSIS
jgi:hypothetical protein